MKIILTYLILGLTFLVESQVVLPGYKDGSWWIIRKRSNNIELPKTISVLGNFDQKGFAIYETNTESGILNKDGEVLFSGKDQFISSIGHGLFVVAHGTETKLLELPSKNILLDKISDYEVFNDTYAHFAAEKDTQLLFLPSRKSWEVGSDFRFIRTYFQSIYADIDSVSKAIYTPKGEKVGLGGNRFYTSRFISYFLNGNRYAITKSRFIEVPFRTGTIEIKNEFLCYSANGKATLLDLENDQILATVPYDEIFPFAFGGYQIKKGNLRGLLNASFREIIPAKYTFISKVNENYQVTSNGLIGLIDKTLELRIPCEFTSIKSDSNFYYTSNRSMFSGLYSKDFKKILETKYTKIVVRDRLIKAYLSDKIRIVQLDFDDNIISDIILDNAVTAKQAKVMGNFVFDRRIIPLGWYYERKAIVDTAGVIQKYAYRWGLKNAADSVIASPRFKNPAFVHNAPFSIVTSPGVQFSFDKIKYKTGRTYQLVNYSTGRKQDLLSYLTFNIEDGINRSFYRCATTKGIGIYGLDNKFEKYSYVSKTNHRLVPYAKGGEVSIEDKACPDCLKYIQIQPVDTSLNELDKADSYYSFFRRNVRLADAKWNFLDTNGVNRFAEDFTFANDFYRGTSIVRRKGGWGVVNSDTLFISCTYSSIKRLSEFEDTLFLVKRNASNSLFLDSQLQEIGKGYSNIKSRKKDLVILESNKGRGVYYKGNLLENDRLNARLISEEYWMYRSKRVYYVQDTNGVQVLSTVFKPLDAFSGDYFWVEHKGKTGIISSSGDTIVPFARQKIQQYQHFFLIYSNASAALYDLDFKLLRKQKNKERIIPNKYSAEYAVVKNGKIRVYNLDKELTKKWNLPEGREVDYFQHAYFVGKDFFFQDTFLLEFDKSSRVHLYEDGMMSMDEDIQKTVYYWKSILEPHAEIKSFKDRYLGEQTFYYKNREEEHIQRLGKEVSYEDTPAWKSLHQFSDGLFLKANRKKHTYYNIDLEVALIKYVDRASPFADGLAPVCVEGSWTLMNKKGQFMTYPSYAEIKRISENMYQTKDAPRYGLFDANGNEIIPCKYERIKIISKDIIQVILKGEMGYFNLQGEEIFPI